MNIEDLIILLAMKCQTNPFDSKVVWSFYDQISRGNGFTEKQEQLAIKILKRQVPKINAILGKDITSYLENPVFRLSRRTVNSHKRISIVPSDVFGKAIKVEFPFNEALVERIRKERVHMSHAAWDKDEKAWIFALNERAIQFLIPLVEKEGFMPDEEFADLQLQVNEIQKNLETYVPMVTFDKNSVKFVNVSERVAQPTTNDVLESLFLARKAGIQTWDDGVNDYLVENKTSKAVIGFLNQAPGETFSLNLEESRLEDLEPIIKFLSPCVFIVPGGSELEKVEANFNFLKNMGIKNEEISVLFRLPNETGENFNRFVKHNMLNGPITENTKVVFISSKIPKTIIDSTVKFNSVVNFSFYSVHYTIREFIKYHHNVIHVLEKKQQRDINFANL